MADIELFDSHCHIQEIAAANSEGTHTERLWAKAGWTLDEVLARGREAGVADYMLVGCALADSKLAVKLAPELQGAHVSIGIHPHEAAATLERPGLMDEFAALATDPSVVAIGECGLDYFYEHSPKDAQVEILKFQLELARKYQKPLIFHVREAFDDFWPIYEAFGRPSGVLHSFTDTAANLARGLENGLYIGINGIATFAKDPAQQAVYASVPLERMLLETDAPYLTPVPHRGKVNELQHVRDVAEFVARTRNVEIGQVASQTTTNARALFNL